MKIRVRLLAVICASVLSAVNLARAQTLRVVHNFGVNGPQYPVGPLTQGRDGKLYGASIYPSAGTIWRMGANGQTSEIYAFDGITASLPSFGLMLATDGTFYGGTNFGGGANDGVLYQVTPNGAFNVLHEFQGSADGTRPLYPPVEAADGSLFGNTYGDLFPSTVYQYDPSSLSFRIIYTFPEAEANNAGLLQASNGKLYGVTQTGGMYGVGILFELTTSGELLSSYTFTCGNDGGYPGSTLIEGPDGTMYGTTGTCGSGGGGTVFKYRDGSLTTLHSFNRNGASSWSVSGLVLATDGYLYGTTFRETSTIDQSVFRIATNGAGYTQLFRFGPSTGEFPNTFVQHTNGVLYSTASGGGRYGYGTVFSVDIGAAPFITFVRSSGAIGTSAQILGQGLTGASAVTFNGVSATKFKVVNDTFMNVVVPMGANTGSVVVTTPSGQLTSNVTFRIVP